MLVLSRKLGESVAIGASDNGSRVVQVTLLEIGNSHIKLGFEGPRDLPIHRWEVWMQIASARRKGDEAADRKASGDWEDDGGLSAPLDGCPSLVPAD